MWVFLAVLLSIIYRLTEQLLVCIEVISSKLQGREYENPDRSPSLKYLFRHVSDWPILENSFKHTSDLPIFENLLRQICDVQSLETLLRLVSVIQSFENLFRQVREKPPLGLTTNNCL